MKLHFTDQPIEGPIKNETTGDSGAELVFFGRVRDLENGIRITALDYEYYPQMAEAMLDRIARTVRDRFDINDLDCTHRTGIVPVGQASVRIVIRSRHRKAALQALDWFIDKLKEEVPIWKWGIGPDGERFPSDSS